MAATNNSTDQLLTAIPREEIISAIVWVFFTKHIKDIPRLKEVIKFLWEGIQPSMDVTSWVVGKFVQPEFEYTPSKNVNIPSARIVMEKLLNIFFNIVQQPSVEGVYSNPDISDVKTVVTLFLSTVQQQTEEDGNILFPNLVADQINEEIFSIVKDRIAKILKRKGEEYKSPDLSSYEVAKTLLGSFEKTDEKNPVLLEKVQSFVKRMFFSPLLEMEEQCSHKIFVENVLETVKPPKDGEFPNLPSRVRKQFENLREAISEWRFATIVSVKNPKKKLEERYYLSPDHWVPAHLKDRNDPTFREQNLVKVTTNIKFSAIGKEVGGVKHIRFPSNCYATMHTTKITYSPKKGGAPFLPPVGTMVCYLPGKPGEASAWFCCSGGLYQRNSLLRLDAKGKFHNKSLTWYDVQRDTRLRKNSLRRVNLIRGELGLPKLTKFESEVSYDHNLSEKTSDIDECSSYYAFVQLVRFGMLPNRNSYTVGKDGVLFLPRFDVPKEMYISLLKECTDYDPVKDHGMTWGEVFKYLHHIDHPPLFIGEMKDKMVRDFEARMKGAENRRKKIEEKQVEFEDSNFPAICSTISVVEEMPAMEIPPIEKKRRQWKKKNAKPVFALEAEEPISSVKTSSFRSVVRPVGPRVPSRPIGRKLGKPIVDNIEPDRKPEEPENAGLGYFVHDWGKESEDIGPPIEVNGRPEKK